MPVLKNVLLPVTDLDAAIAFYRDGLGFDLKFRDGDRYAALDTGTVTLALVAADEDVTGGVPAPSYLVDDLAAALRDLAAAGAELIGGPSQGSHEARAVLRDTSGHLLVVYQKS
jgi:predicted enzyme related to lactoylglutathione lyase